MATRRRIVVLGLGGLAAVAMTLGCSAGDDGVSDPLLLGASGAGGAGAGMGGGSGGIGMGGATTPPAGGTGNVTFTTGGAGNAPTAGAAGAPGGGGRPPRGACDPAVDTPVDEQCGNGIDDDLDGFIDEHCTCAFGATQQCFAGLPSEVPNCTAGTQTCSGSQEFPSWGPCEGSTCGQAPPAVEVCDNGQDDDCDGLIDEGCFLDTAVDINGDCLGIWCPAQAPHPIGCDIVMEGGDARGCVAHAPGHQAVYFQEGNACPVLGFGDAGHISGTLFCASQPAVAPIGPDNCVINKTETFYPDSPDGCPK